MGNVFPLPVREEIASLEKKLQNGGEPPYDGGMELTERVSKMEEKLSGFDARLGLVESDLRDLGKKIDAHFYWMLAAMFGLAGLMAKGFHWF